MRTTRTTWRSLSAWDLTRANLTTSLSECPTRRCMQSSLEFQPLRPWTTPATSNRGDNFFKLLLFFQQKNCFLALSNIIVRWSKPEIDIYKLLYFRPLRNLISYLKQKEAAGVISMTYKDDLGDSQQGVLYCFPPCEYATDLLHRRDCDLVEEGKEDFLLVVVVCGSHA